jgi:uncharacterized protein (TIGR03086 family)
MSVPLDLGPAAQELQRVALGVRDDQVRVPTPCDGMPVGSLLRHVLDLSRGLTAAARKETGAGDGAAMSAVDQLDPQWRDLLPGLLDGLVQAWTEPDAWEGMTWAGGLELPGPVVAAVVADELVMHGWDLARATGQEFHPDGAALQAAYDFAAQIPDVPEARGGLFGPRVPVADDAPLLDRALGLAGRDPAWMPPAR